MYRTLKERLRQEDYSNIEWQYLTEICRHSNSLYNTTLFTCKQAQIESDKEGSGNTYWNKQDVLSIRKLGNVKASYSGLCSLLKTCDPYKAMPAQIAQQTIGMAVEAIKSYNALRTTYFSDPGKVEKLPSFPRYRKSGGYFQFSMPISIMSKRLDLESGWFVGVPVASCVSKDELLESRVELLVPPSISFEHLKEVTVKPTSNGLEVLWVYDDGIKPLEKNALLDYSQAIGIDPGIVQWMTVVSTRGKTFYIDGGEIVTAVRKYADRVAAIKKGKSEKYWDLTLSILTEKLNRLKRDLVNKAARFIISHCLKEGIGNIVFGRNKQQELRINIGRENNHAFTQMPFVRVIKRLEEMAPEYGIHVEVTEESYTSKSDSLANDFLPVHGAVEGESGAKPANWKPSGKRTNRDTYVTGDGRTIHADCNAGYNILRKVADKLGLYLDTLQTKWECLTRPHRYSLRQMTKAYRVEALQVSQ